MKEDRKLTISLVLILLWISVVVLVVNRYIKYKI